MEKQTSNPASRLIEGLIYFLRRCIYIILSVGPIPTHVAFIMDGNRRYATKQRLEKDAGHRAGYLSLVKMLQYCYELDMKYVTIYAFSIDNFKRRPEEVQSTMKLIHEKIVSLIEEESIINQYGVRVHFSGNLDLLTEPVKLAAERVMLATAHNSKAMLSICIAYTSTDEIVHAVEETCRETSGLIGLGGNTTGDGTPSVDLATIEKHMYMAIAPDPDVIIRTSGETRLSNFLLWQSASSLLYTPKALWPDIGFWHIVRAILDFQRNRAYLDKNRKQNWINGLDLLCLYVVLIANQLWCISTVFS